VSLRRPRKIPDALTLASLRVRVLGEFWEGEPRRRLERSIAWLRSSAMPAADRQFVIGLLDRELDREIHRLHTPAGRKALAARMASRLVDSGLSRELASLVLSGSDKEAAALFERVRRQRSKKK
jgi:hypothetical protein